MLRETIAIASYIAYYSTVSSYSLLESIYIRLALYTARYSNHFLKFDRLATQLYIASQPHSYSYTRSNLHFRIGACIVKGQLCISIQLYATALNKGMAGLGWCMWPLVDNQQLQGANNYVYNRVIIEFIQLQLGTKLKQVYSQLTVNCGYQPLTKLRMYTCYIRRGLIALLLE